MCAHTYIYIYLSPSPALAYIYIYIYIFSFLSSCEAVKAIIGRWLSTAIAAGISQPQTGTPWVYRENYPYHDLDTCTKGEDKDYIVFPAEWNYGDLGSNHRASGAARLVQDSTSPVF